MESVRITTRLPKPLLDACTALADAAGLGLSEWLRSLAERETGVKVAMLSGFAAMSKRKARRAQSAGGKAKAAKSILGKSGNASCNSSDV